MQGFPRIGVEARSRQIAEMVGLQQHGVVAIGAVQLFFDHMLAVVPRCGTVILTETRRMAGLAIRVDVDRTAPPVGTGLAAVAARGTAGLIGRIVAAAAALGVVGGCQRDGCGVAAVEMNGRFCACALMAGS